MQGSAPNGGYKRGWRRTPRPPAFGGTFEEIFGASSVGGRGLADASASASNPMGMMQAFAAAMGLRLPATIPSAPPGAGGGIMDFRTMGGGSCEDGSLVLDCSQSLFQLNKQQQQQQLSQSHHSITTTSSASSSSSSSSSSSCNASSTDRGEDEILRDSVGALPHVSQNRLRWVDMCSLRALLRNGMDDVFNLIFDFIETPWNVAFSSIVFHTKVSNWCLLQWSLAKPLLREPGCENHSFVRVLDHLVQCYRDRTHANSSLIHHQIRARALRNHNAVCFDVDEMPFVKGPVLTRDARQIHIGIFSEKPARSRDSLGLSYLENLRWLQGRSIGLFYLRGPCPRMTRMLEAVQELSLDIDTMVMDVCPLRVNWFCGLESLWAHPTSAPAPSSHHHHHPLHRRSRPGLCSDLIVIPEFIDQEVMEESDALVFKMRFEEYERRFADLSISVHLLLDQLEARAVRELIPQAHLICLSRLPPRLGPIGNKKHQMTEILQLLSPLHRMGWDRAPALPSVLSRDATGRPCVLAPPSCSSRKSSMAAAASSQSAGERDSNNGNGAPELRPPTPPTLVVTDTTSAVPALVVTTEEEEEDSEGRRGLEANVTGNLGSSPSPSPGAALLHQWMDE